MSANDPLARLRRIALFLTGVAVSSADATSLSKLQPGDAQWFIAATAEFESGLQFGRSFDSCAGFVQQKPGAAELRSRRDALLVEIASTHFPQAGVRGASQGIRQAVGRYRRTAAWRQHSHQDAPPDGLTALDAALHRLLRTRRPLSDKTVRNVLGQNATVDPAQGSAEAGGQEETRA